MYEPLIAALRNVSEYDSGYAKLMYDAADAIEAQDRHILTLQHEMMAEAESHIALVERMNKQIEELQADVRPVVLCRDCIYYVKSEEINGEKMCVRDADWSVEDGCYYGFTEYPQPDWFCADGVKMEES